MKQALILEADTPFRQELSQTLESLGFTQLDVDVADNWRDACLLLAYKQYDIAFVAIELVNARLFSALRMVQLTLRIVLVIESPQQSTLGSDIGSIQGILIRRRLQVLAAMLDAALAQPVTEAARGSVKWYTSRLMIDKKSIGDVIHTISLNEYINTIILAHTSGLIAQQGFLTVPQAAAILVIAQQGWQDKSYPTLVQYLHLRDSGDWLIYSSSLGSGYYLSLVALPETSLGLLQERTMEIVKALASILDIKLPANEASVVLQNAGHDQLPSKTFVIAWRSLEKLPRALRQPLSKILEEIAQKQACIIRHLIIKTDWVQLVVTCPPGKNSIWLAHQFKKGSEAAIQQQFGIEATLWATGYYANESEEPLTATETDIFLTQNPVI